MGYKNYVLEKIDEQRFTYKGLNEHDSVLDLATYDGTNFTDKPALQEWIDELESGQYEQVTGGLGFWDYENPDAPCIGGYCCLGVQQKTMADKGLLVIGNNAGQSGDELAFMYEYDSDPGETYEESNVLTNTAVDYLGLTVDSPYRDGAGDPTDPMLVVWYPREEEGGGPAVYLTASQLNDTYEMDFNQIAMILRAYL